MPDILPQSSAKLPQNIWFSLGDEFGQPVVAEPPLAFWRELVNYDSALVQGLIEPLARSVHKDGCAPIWLQEAIVQHLHWYFTVDARERAPTVVISGSRVEVFHEHVRAILQHIDPAIVLSLHAKEISEEVRQALLSYKEPPDCSTMTLDAYDQEQGLARITYYVHGDPPAERFEIDGNGVHPTYAKYRACNYFGRRLLRQRIVWMPVADASSLAAHLAGVPIPITLGSQQLGASEILCAARVAFPPGKGSQEPLPAGWVGWKVRLMKMLAHMPTVRQKFAKAWVFADRETDADDNAEHLYRWIREHHPEVNAWFLLSPNSSDWSRLKADGFRLVPPGLTRKLLILNSEHIVSSHADIVLGSCDPALYGDQMTWRFSFVPHGISKDDVSHWLGSKAFDLFVTSSPAEQASIVDDDTPYQFTEREARYIGLPRRDKLLELVDKTPSAQVDIVLVMPTWRGSLVDDRSATTSATQAMAAFAASDYAKHWRALLNSKQLRELSLQHGKTIMFMAHPNAAPYIEAFDPPAHVKILTKANTSFMPLLCRTVALITDYTSVAFELAFLRRAVFYYQFDRDAFYGGSHNWRPGYFDYDRDGFGPVSFDEEQLINQLRRFLDAECKPEPQYLLRMERAMPDRDRLACQGVFDRIVGLRHSPPGIAKNIRF